MNSECELHCKLYAALFVDFSKFVQSLVYDSNEIESVLWNVLTISFRVVVTAIEKVFDCCNSVYGNFWVLAYLFLCYFVVKKWVL